MAKKAKTAKNSTNAKKAAKRAARAAAQAVNAGAIVGTGACRLIPVPMSTDFQGPTGAKVTLVTKNHVGTVLIAKLEYGGKQHVPAGQAVAQIELTLQNGVNTVKAVFVFDASTSGRGELREDCGNGDSHFLRALAGHEPLQIMRIAGV